MRGAKRDGDARGMQQRDVQPAAGRDAPRGRAACHGKSGGAWGLLRVHRRRKGALRMRLWAHARCIFPPVRRPGWTRGAFVWQLQCHKARAG